MNDASTLLEVCMSCDSTAVVVLKYILSVCFTIAATILVSRSCADDVCCFLLLLLLLF